MPNTYVQNAQIGYKFAEVLCKSRKGYVSFKLPTIFLKRIVGLKIDCKQAVRDC
jgi:hypothetical protein